MPRFLAAGHVTRDRYQGGDLLGGTVSYAARAVQRLGWQVGALTAAGPDFDAPAELPGVESFVQRSAATTRFENVYEADGTRHQRLLARAAPIGSDGLPEAWRAPDVLLLGSVADEIPRGFVEGFTAGVVGATGQGWLRQVAPDGRVSPRHWADPGHDLPGVHVLFLSLHDVGGHRREAEALLAHVPVIALTQGWQGLELLTRDGCQFVPSLPREEVDPTGAGDVFAAAFLVRYHESQDLLEAAAFAACAASCVVEGVGASALGDRAEVERRLAQRERLIEKGEWDE